MTLAAPLYYPDSDGKRMAENTVQADWMGILKWNAEAQFRDRPDVFVAMDNLIYPVEGDNKLRQAPDVYLAFGRPKGDRGSYQVWREGGLFPQVVMEVWSPSSDQDDLGETFDFYQRYGAEEYYLVYAEFPAHVQGWVRSGDRLQPISDMAAHVSPRLGWRFEVERGRLTVVGPDGRPLRRPDEIAAERDEATRRADRLAAKLRALGVDPDAV